MSNAASSPAARPTRGRQRNAEAAARSLATVLDLVRTGQAATRQEIERASELGRAIVADRLATLAELGLVDESELGAATGGRAPRLVRFEKDAARILVATLDQTAIGVALADLSGNLLIEHHEAIDLADPPAATVDRLAALFDWLLEKDQHSRPIWGIGISMPGPVQAPPGKRYLSSTPPLLPGWEGYLFVETLLARFGAPVWLRSSVETMAVGELAEGSANRSTEMLFIKVGKRIGAGLVLHGRLYRGANGAAGLIGQLPVELGGRRGSLDALAGSDNIAREGHAAAEDGRSPALSDILHRAGEVTAIDVGQAAQMGDPISMEIMSQSGRMIGHVVASLTSLLNPSLIVLSGSIAQTNDILLAAVREAVYRESHPLVTRDLRIGASQLGSSAGLLGAALVVVEELFDPEALRSWVIRGTPIESPDFAESLAHARKVLGDGRIRDQRDVRART